MTDVDAASVVAFAREPVRIPTTGDPARGRNERPAAEPVAAKTAERGRDPARQR